jgi:membrane-anchored mycosin MYCP
MARRRAAVVLALAAAVLLPAAAAPVAPAAAGTPPVEEPSCDDDVDAFVTRTPSALAAMTVQDAWDRGALGQGVTVAVVHAGVDATNAHLAGAVLAGRSFVPGDGDPTGRTTTVDEGTVLATVVAGRRVEGSGVVGVAPQAQVLPVRWYVADGSEEPGGSKESAGVARLAEAITWAGANGADVVVVPNAVSAPDRALEAAVASVQRAGGLVVASAGRATAGEPRWPAAYPGVLGVTGVGADGAPGDEPATGAHVAIAAPGDDVVGGATGRSDCVVLPPGSPPSSEWAVGTLAGAAALVRSAHPDATAEEVAYRLLASAQRPRQSQRSDSTGWGLVRPYAAITLTLDPSRPGPPFPGGVGAEGTAQVRTIEAARAAPDPAAPARRAAVWWGLLGLAALGVLVLLTRWNRLTDSRFGDGSGEPAGRG